MSADGAPIKVDDPAKGWIRRASWWAYEAEVNGGCALLSLDGVSVLADDRSVELVGEALFAEVERRLAWLRAALEVVS